MTEPTPQLVQDYWAYMTQKFGSRVIQKDDAPAMELASVALSILGILDRNTFMERYTTTLINHIYIPFKIGVPHEHYNLWDQIRVCAHEHEHVYQFRQEGVEFCTAYITSTASRAAYEARAMQADQELTLWRTGLMPTVWRLAAKLSDYGCSPADIKTAEAMLGLSDQVIAQGAVISTAGKAALTWLNEKAKELRHGA